MTNKLEIYGLDLTGMGIGDVAPIDSETLSSVAKFLAFHAITEPLYIDTGNGVIRIDPSRATEMNLRSILGSITFGPVQFVDLSDPEDIDDDEDWEFAE